MPRVQISIKLDRDLLTRVDGLAELVGTTRTAVIEQAVKNDLPEQEAFQKSLENPAMRAIHKQITRPSVLKLLAKLADAELSDEQLADVLEKAPRHREAAKARVQGSKPVKGRIRPEGA